MVEVVADILDRPVRLEEIILPFHPAHPNDIFILQAETVDVFNVGIEELLLGNDVIVHRAMMSQIRRTVSISRS